MLTLAEIVVRLKEIVGARLVSTSAIDKINYQHTLADGAYRALPDVIVRIESDPQGNDALAKILEVNPRMQYISAKAARAFMRFTCIAQAWPNAPQFRHLRPASGSAP